MQTGVALGDINGTYENSDSGESPFSYMATWVGRPIFGRKRDSAHFFHRPAFVGGAHQRRDRLLHAFGIGRIGLGEVAELALSGLKPMPGITFAGEKLDCSTCAK